MRYKWVLKAMLAVAITVVTAGGASASVIFSDNFDADTPTLGITTSFPNWTIDSGSIDVVGVASGGFGYLCEFAPSPAACIDMDGSTNAAGTMSTSAPMTFLPGINYYLSFWIAGNQRKYTVADGVGPTDTTVVSIDLGTVYNESFTLAAAEPWRQISRTFTVLAPTSTGKLTFAATGGDNVGMLLDDVVIETVPEPMTLTLLGSGLVGLVARRRRGRS